MKIDYTLFKLYEDRLKWAYIAKKDFYNSLADEDIKALYMNTENNQVNVSVYGKSQVGKTTLILKLIGIKEEHMQHVSNILRGKRKVGNSATVTAMIYSMSEDDDFYYCESNEKPKKLNDEEIEEELARLRERAEANQLLDIDKVKVSIPRKYYDMNSRQVSVNIIDLPGDSSSEPKEQIHVNRIISKFIPVSNLIILIARADQLANLRELSLPGIEDWKDQPERFKIVFTHSVSNQSTIDSIARMSDIHKDSFINIFKSEFLRNVDVQLPKENMIYPLEYGESWEVLDKSNKAVKDKLAPILNVLYNDLIQEIEKSQNEYNLFMMNAKMYKSIKKVIERNTKKFDNRIGDIRNSINRLEGKVDINKQSLDRKYSNSTTLNYEIKKLWDNFKPIKIDTEKFSDSSYSEPYWKKTTGLIRFLDSTTDKVCEISSSFIKEFNNNYPGSNVKNDVIKICSEVTEYSYDKLNEYIIVQYFLDSSWYEDMALVNTAVEEMVKKSEESINKTCSSAISLKVDSLQKEIKFVAEEIAIDLDYDKKNKKRLSDLKNALTSLLSMRQEYAKRSNRDLETSKAFLKYVYRGFFEEYSKYIELINSKNISIGNKTVYLDYLYIIANELTKLEEQII